MKWTVFWHPRWMWLGGYSEANVNSVVLFMKYSCIPSAFIGSKVWICSIQRENASMLYNMIYGKRFLHDSGYCWFWILSQEFSRSGGLTGTTSSLRLLWMRWFRRRQEPLPPPERGQWTCCCWALQARPRVVTRSTDWQVTGWGAIINQDCRASACYIDRVPLYVLIIMKHFSNWHSSRSRKIYLNAFFLHLEHCMPKFYTLCIFRGYSLSVHAARGRLWAPPLGVFFFSSPLACAGGITGTLACMDTCQHFVKGLKGQGRYTPLTYVFLMVFRCIYRVL